MVKIIASVLSVVVAGVDACGSCPSSAPFSRAVTEFMGQPCHCLCCVNEGNGDCYCSVKVDSIHDLSRLEATVDNESMLVAQSNKDLVAFPSVASSSGVDACGSCPSSAPFSRAVTEFMGQPCHCLCCVNEGNGDCYCSVKVDSIHDPIVDNETMPVAQSNKDIVALPSVASSSGCTKQVCVYVLAIPFCHTENCNSNLLENVDMETTEISCSTDVRPGDDDAIMACYEHSSCCSGKPADATMVDGKPFAVGNEVHCSCMAGQVEVTHELARVPSSNDVAALPSFASSSGCTKTVCVYVLAIPFCHTESCNSKLETSVEFLV